MQVCINDRTSRIRKTASWNRVPAMLTQFFALVLVLGVSGCSSRLDLTAPKVDPDQDRAPANHNIDLSRIPDPVPRLEPRSATGNSPYRVYGVRYTPMAESRGYSEQGVASWYGLKFHGRRTSSGEPYDIYKMTAAHRTLPLPSYVRVENLNNGRSIIVRVNDRGPFSNDRVIDLSYVAALKLDIVNTGTAPVRVTAIDPGTTVTTNTVGRQTVVGSVPVSNVNASGVLGGVDAGTVTDGGAGIVTGTIVSGPVSSGSVSGSATGAHTSEPLAPAMPSTQSAHVVSTAPPAAAGELQSGVSYATQIFVQVGAFGSYDNAVRLQSRLADNGFGPVIVTPTDSAGRTLYRVRIGPVASAETANAEALRVRQIAPGLGLSAAAPPRVVVE